MSFSVRTAKAPGKTVQSFHSQRRAISQSCTQLQQARAASPLTNRTEEDERNHIHLKGLPRSAKPADVMRLARQAVKDNGLAKAIAFKLDYNRFVPTGRAFITFNSGAYLAQVVRALQGAQISSLPVKAFISDLNVSRRRGGIGRKEAAERAVLDGCGCGGGIDTKGCDVVLYGLPGTIAAPALRLYLRRIGVVKFARNGEPDCDVYKIEAPRRGFSATSKHLVRLNSSSEAHAFVRKMHMTYFLPEVWQDRYLIRARVVY